MKNLKKIFAAVSALTVLTLTGCGDKNESGQKVIYYDDSNSYSQETEKYEKSDGEAYKQEDLIQYKPTIPANLNEKAQVSGVDLILKNVYDVGIIELNNESKTKKQVIALNCEVTNNTYADITVNSFDFTIQYVDGEYMYIETGLREEMAANKKIKGINDLNATIKPGETAGGYASLSVPPEWQTITVYFTPLDVSAEDAITYEITRDMLETQ